MKNKDNKKKEPRRIIVDILSIASISDLNKFFSEIRYLLFWLF